MYSKTIKIDASMHSVNCSNNVGYIMEPIKLADGLGYVLKGYYKNIRSAHITGYTDLNDGSGDKSVRVFFCGFKAKNLNKPVYLYRSNQRLTYPISNAAGTINTSLFVSDIEMYDLTTTHLSNRNCIMETNVLSPNQLPKNGSTTYKLIFPWLNNYTIEYIISY